MDNFAENVSKHFGLPWTGLIEHCRKTKKDKPPDDSVVIGKAQCISPTTTRLQKEDAATFGLRPALDECLLSVCNICGAVIKPQALLSHIERRHKDTSDGNSVQHLQTEKPIVKGLTVKSKVKNSPRNSPKLTSTCDTNLLDKYKLPNRPVNRTATGKFAPGLIEKNNKALAKHLSSARAQPVVALDDVSPKLVNLSNSRRNTESPRDSLASTPKTPQPSTDASTVHSRQYASKRSLDSSLSKLSKSEPPKKVRLEAVSTLSQSNIKTEDNSWEKLTSSLSPGGAVTSIPSPQEVYSQIEGDVTVHSQTEPDNTFICAEKTKPPSIKVHQLTTFDKSIPCKDREYDPDRHCGCWLDDWGKHCTRSLTCKSHALSLRRKVAGRSKPFDVLLQDHRDAKEALQLSKPLKGKGKASSSSSSKAKRQSTDQNLQSSVFGDPEAERSDITRAQTDYLGYSSFHPRPLAAPSYNARLCGNAYVQNRQMDILRMAFKCAIEQPKQPKKSIATKGIKSINGGVNKTHKIGKDTSSATTASQALIHKAHSAKLKNLVDKRKGAKRTSTDGDQPTKISPPYSHRMTSPVGIVPPTSRTMIISTESSGSLPTSSLPIKSVSSGINSSTLNLITNGATPLYRANMLKDLGLHTSRQKGIQSDISKVKLTNRNSIHLTTNASGIATLASKHLTILDPQSIPYIYSASGANNSTDQTGPSHAGAALPAPTINTSDIISRAASVNGLVLQSPNSNTRLDNQPSLVDLLPQAGSTELSAQPASSSIHYIKSVDSSNVGSTDPNYLHSANQAEFQQLAVSNRNTMVSFNSQVMQAMQKQHNKPNVSMMASQSSIPQQQPLHHNTTSPATAHHGYS